MALNFARAAAALAGGLMTGAGEGLIAEAKELHQARRDELQDQRATERLKLQDEMAGKRQEASDARQHQNRMAEQEQRQGYESAEADKKREHEKELKTIPQAESDSTTRLRNAQAKWYEERPAATGRSPEAQQLVELINNAEPDDPRIAQWQARLDYLTTRSGGKSSTGGVSVEDDRLLKRLEESFTSPMEGVNRKALADHLEQIGRPDLAKLYDPSRSEGGGGALRGFGNLDAGAAAGRDAGIGAAVGTDNRRNDIQSRDRARTEGTQRIVNPQAPGGRTKPSQYPDARWSEKAGGWVIQRDGKWLLIEE